MRSVGSMRSMQSIGSRASSAGGQSRSQIFLTDYQERELKEELKRERIARATLNKNGKARVKQVSVTHRYLMLSLLRERRRSAKSTRSVGYHWETLAWHCTMVVWWA